MAKFIPKEIVLFVVNSCEEVLDLMRCSICSRFPISGDRFACSGSPSHFLCDDCATQSMEKLCPHKPHPTGEKKCGAPYQKTFLGPLEKLYSESLFPCTTAECPAVLNGPEMLKHLRSCGHRIQVTCHFKCSNEEISAVRYVPHLVTFHKIPNLTLGNEETTEITLKSSPEKTFEKVRCVYFTKSSKIIKIFGRFILLVVHERRTAFAVYSVIMGEDEDEEEKEDFFLVIGIDFPSEGDSDESDVLDKIPEKRESSNDKHKMAMAGFAQESRPRTIYRVKILQATEAYEDALIKGCVARIPKAIFEKLGEGVKLTVSIQKGNSDTTWMQQMLPCPKPLGDIDPVPFFPLGDGLGEVASAKERRGVVEQHSELVKDMLGYEEDEEGLDPDADLDPRVAYLKKNFKSLDDMPEELKRQILKQANGEYTFS